MALALVSSQSALPATAPRPPAAPPRALALPTPATAAAATASGDIWRGLRTRERDLAVAKRDWTKAVWELLAVERHGRRLYTVATAVAAVSAPDRWPLLLTAGKRGGSWMSPTNYRRTVAALTSGNGRPAWDRIEALAPGWAGGRPSRIEDCPEFVRDCLALWLNPRQPPLSQVWRDVARVYARAGWDRTVLPPADSIAHHIRRHVDPRLVERYRGGAQQYSNTVRGYISRRMDEAVGDVFCADHRIVDYWARVIDPETGAWAARRLYCSSIEDLRSRYRVATLLYADQAPNNRIVAEVLWNASRANGGSPPLVFYIDNGKDFCKVGLTMPVALRTADGAPIIDPHTGRAFEHSVCRELGIEIKLSRGYNGKEKPIEGSFGMDARLFDRQQIAFTGNTAVERARLNGEHYSGDVMRLPTVQQAMEAYHAWLDEFHALPTRSKHCPAATRADAWRTMRRPSRAPMTPEQLDFAFLIPQALCPLVCRTPAGTGGVRYSGWTYSHADLQRAGLWGKPVMLKTSWADAAVPHERGGTHPPRVFLFHPDGRFICQAAADGTVAMFARDDDERAELAEHCHVINAAAQLDTTDYQRLTGRTRMIADPADPAEIAGRLPAHADADTAAPAALVMPAATPPRRPSLPPRAARPAVSAVRGADAADLVAAIEDAVFGGGQVPAADSASVEDEELVKLMEGME